MKDEIRVLAVEDDRGLRASLKLLLDSSPGFHCPVACMTAEEGLRHLGPSVDVVLMDINLPGQRGSEAVAEYRRKAPGIPVVMLTVHEDPDEIFRSLCNGASGYILKKTPPDGILAAVKDAVLGGAPMSPEIARRVVEHFHRLPPPQRVDEALSPQETRLVRLLADGATYKGAADEMGITVNTVRNYVRSIYEKLHVHSKSAAVSKALKARLI